MADKWVLQIKPENRYIIEVVRKLFQQTQNILEPSNKVELILSLVFA